MDINTLETLVQKALEYAEQTCTFAFQGGEPTLAGLDFFEKLLEFQKKYNFKKLHINNTLQTNGMVVDARWANFLSKNKFLVGLSLDGPKDIHDNYRINVKNKSSFLKVMKTIDLFEKYHVEFNILFVVTSYSASHTTKIYNFFKKHNFRYLQFIPCLDPLGEGNGSPWLTPNRYAYFLKTLFNHWYADMVKRNIISIRYFDNIVRLAMGYRPESCGMLGECTCQFVVESNGDVYPCDFYVIDQWYLGNIKHSSFEEIRNAQKAEIFIDISRHIDPKCSRCQWFNLCRGGCIRDREPFEKNKPALNRHCRAYMEFFEYAGEKITELARMSLKGNFN